MVTRTYHIGFSGFSNNGSSLLVGTLSGCLSSWGPVLLRRPGSPDLTYPSSSRVLTFFDPDGLSDPAKLLTYNLAHHPRPHVHPTALTCALLNGSIVKAHWSMPDLPAFCHIMLQPGKQSKTAAS
jgi:hypothetical protein